MREIYHVLHNNNNFQRILCGIKLYSRAYPLFCYCAFDTRLLNQGYASGSCHFARNAGNSTDRWTENAKRRRKDVVGANGSKGCSS